MKRRWFKLIPATFVVLILLGLGLFVWFVWPDSGTLVRQACNNNIGGLHRSLLLGADINGYERWGWRRDNLGRTPLTAAIDHGNLNTIRFLLSHGADSNRIDGFGYTPIVTAVMNERLDVAKILVYSGATVDVRLEDDNEESSMTAVDYSRKLGYHQIEEYLTNEANKAEMATPRKPSD
jgi:ankyrin repeat protein